MSQEENKIRWQRDTNNLYRAIGEFVVKFEHVTFALNLVAKAILQRCGLKDEQISNIILAGMTAEPLRSLVESLASQTGFLKNDDLVQFRSLLKRFQILTSERNDVVHGAWLVEWYNYASNQDVYEVAHGIKLHRNKDGSATKEFMKSVPDFEMMTKEAVALTNQCHRMLGKFIFDEDGNQTAFKMASID